MSITDRRGVTVSATDPAIGSDPNPGLAWKAPALVATTGSNISLSGLQTIDGVVLAAGDRVLVKDQTDQTTNGLYNAASSSWTRTIDANNSSQWTPGTEVFVTGGTANAGNSFQLTTAGAIVLGTSNLTFASASTPNISIEYVIDGGGSAIGTGFKGQIEVPFGCTVLGYTIVADAAASAVIDVYNVPLGVAPSSSQSICAAAKPTLTSARAVRSTTLTGWTTAIAARSLIGFNVDSAANAARLTISLFCSRP